FHFFDQPAAWAEFRRVLAPGGRALVGMINPRSAAGSRRLTQLTQGVSKTPTDWPTGPEIRRLAVDAGFEVTGQPEVAWRFHWIVPLVLTVGRAPAA
ncbi:MAG TPA: SAM-dependent methyltransferase, partial [Acidimicrobiia bacterium]|nr:SAM-dependent methyltransferase [Acidimicrobiia bacterium]